MEGLTRLVSESLARHGFDRPLDYRRLQWSRWFRCESPHSLLFVPSKPGVFALAEEMMDLGTVHAEKEKHEEKGDHVEMAASAVPPTLSDAKGSGLVERNSSNAREKDALNRAQDGSYQGMASAVPLEGQHRSAALAAVPRRLLAVTQFFDAEDMAYVLDRMLSRQNAMRARLTSGRYFVRFVVIEDESQRRSICAALNQWIVNSTEKATGIGNHFASSLELTPQTEHADDKNVPQAKNVAQESVARTRLSPNAGTAATHVETVASAVPRSEASGSGLNSSPIISPTAPHLNSGAATNIHCPFPSGF